ncbi:MAG: NuA4 histone H4 acetyltransferase complex and the SWR1 complex subunit [Phylliscum demangeonii]|nr:MAG: NuA4 histone H4 acetyltransferase complex and the SWR1 complex subunit [Phylliscum demangeonii]
MPAPLGGKRVKGVSVFRPFVFGNISRPIDSDHRPPDVPSDHSHQWTVWVKGVNDEDISYWLKKVQFKLHDTYASSLRVVEQPPFEITETGWGEFEMAIKLYFVPESGEKPQTIWHTLKIHPWGPDAEAQRVEKRPIISQNYEEIIFNEPVEAFYDLLTGGGGHASEKPSSARGKAAAAKGASKQAHAVAARVEAGARTAEIPLRSTRENPYSRDTEGKELDRMRDAVRKVEELIRAERETLKQREAALEEFKTSDESGGKK